MSFAPGVLLSHYRLVEKLGEGAMGVVWKAIDTTLGRAVAVKVLFPRDGDDPCALERLEREAKVLAALNHPNIVTIHSIEHTEDRCFIVMELLCGKTLEQLLPDRGVSLTRLLELSVPLADAIRAAHEKGITHRDLKPANIVVTDEGVLKVLDFGLARAEPASSLPLGDDDTTLTFMPEPEFGGTLHYMSPEQIQGGSAETPADVFALGVIFYRMATGRLPFEGQTAAALVASVLRDRPTPPSRLQPGLPRELDRVVARCLEKDAARRWTAAELRARLQTLAGPGMPARSDQVPSVAVLPFVDMSPEKDQDYFCEGLAEEIINALSRVRDLRVASRTSSFHLKDCTLDSREIADQLGVAVLLEGGVRKAGEQLRITVELISAADGCQIWSKRFDRELKDVFAIQDEIAASIVEALSVTLTPGERRAIKQIATADVQAFDYYLRGKKYFYQYKKQAIEYALQMYSRAIDLDPSYALAWAGVADCASYLFMNAEHDEPNRRRADRASRKALQLDPDLAEAHTSRGVVLAQMERFEEAEREFETALTLNPKLFDAHYFYARESFTQGKKERAIRLYEQAFEVRPDDYQSPLLVAQSYEDLGRPVEAEDARRRGIRIAERHLDLNPDDVRALYMGANGLVALGETERGLEWADRARVIDPDEPMLLYNLACIYALAGNADEACDCLERALDRGFAHGPWLRKDSNLDPVRDHPRFAMLLARLAAD